MPSFRGQKSTFGKSSNFVDGFIALIREYDDVWNPSKTFRFADEIGHARKKNPARHGRKKTCQIQTALVPIRGCYCVLCLFITLVHNHWFSLMVE